MFLKENLKQYFPTLAFAALSVGWPFFLLTALKYTHSLQQLFKAVNYGANSGKPCLLIVAILLMAGHLRKEGNVAIAIGLLIIIPIPLEFINAGREFWICSGIILPALAMSLIFRMNSKTLGAGWFTLASYVQMVFLHNYLISDQATFFFKLGWNI